VPRPLRLLIVEDSQEDCELLLGHLRRHDYQVEFTNVDTADEMRAALAARQFDAVISDYSMPGFSAPRARTLLSEVGPDIPFIIVSGTIGEETAVSALKAGAHDFLTKANLARLVPALERELREAEERRRRRAAERALIEMREHMRVALEAAGVGTWEADTSTGKTVWSEVMERLHGMAPGTFGGTFDDFIAAIHPSDRDRVREQIAASIQEHTERRLEYRVIWPDRSVHWLAVIGHTFYDGGDQPFRSAGIGIDITIQKELEVQLLQSQKMESVGNLAGGIAHDFNNLLTAISGYSQLLSERRGLQPAALRDLNEIRLAVDRAAALTNQLLAFSRRQVLAPRVINLNEIVTNLAPMLQRLIEESVHFEFCLAKDAALVNVDPNQLEQVLVNLTVNARDAMPQGGTLTVSTANVVLDKGYAHTHMDVVPGPHALLSVADTGHGIPPDVRDRLFEPFFTTKAKGHGTGLGLATVYGIVKQSGGHIVVDSEPGAGAVFKLYFPAATANRQAQPARAPQPSRDVAGTETILVVEDDPRLRALDERILKRYGYTVLVAANAGDAVRILTEHPAPIHIVVTDVIMPGESGRAVGNWVTKHKPGTKVIYMSGYTDDAISRHGVLEPGAQFLQKPFSPEALARKIRESLSLPTDAR
jgi:two-component system, cell cycle sensor histidine kinase and response regulator CckA